MLATLGCFHGDTSLYTLEERLEEGFVGVMTGSIEKIDDILL